MWVNVHLNPFSIWNSYSFQTELPALLVLGLENKQQPYWHFLLNPTLHKFSFSVQVYFNLQQHGQNVNMFSSCLLLFLSCEVRPLWVRQVRYAVGTETGEAYSRRIQRGKVGTIAPPKTCESIFFHNEFVKFEKHNSRYKDILSSVVSSQ